MGRKPSPIKGFSETAKGGGGKGRRQLRQRAGRGHQLHHLAVRGLGDPPRRAGLDICDLFCTEILRGETGRWRRSAPGAARCCRRVQNSARSAASRWGRSARGAERRSKESRSFAPIAGRSCGKDKCFWPVYTRLLCVGQTGVLFADVKILRTGEPF